jgi:hypothetical protein
VDRGFRRHFDVPAELLDKADRDFMANAVLNTLLQHRLGVLWGFLPYPEREGDPEANPLRIVKTPLDAPQVSSQPPGSTSEAPETSEG